MGKFFTLRVVKRIIQQYAKDLTAGRLASGYEHSYRIYHLAREVGEDVGYDDEVLHAACFLHDIERMVDHPKGSAAKAAAILGETGFPAAKIKQVTDAILHHMPDGEPTNTEGKLLHDANLLDSIGAIGFARLSIGAFFWHHCKSLCDVVSMLERELGHADRFYFSRCEEMAAAKKDFMATAIDNFRCELDL